MPKTELPPSTQFRKIAFGDVSKKAVLLLFSVTVLLAGGAAACADNLFLMVSIRTQNVVHENPIGAFLVTPVSGFSIRSFIFLWRTSRTLASPSGGCARWWPKLDR